MSETDDLERLVDAAWRARREGRHDEAERGLIDVVDRARLSGHRPILVRALGALAHVVRDADQPERALPLYEEAIALGRQGGPDLSLAHSVRHLGDLHRDAGRMSEAGRCYDEALALYRAAPSPPALDFANALRPAALLKESQGEIDAARDLWAEARRLYEAAGIRVAVDECRRHLTKLA